MTKSYAFKGTKLKKAKLSKPVLLAIGRLVRAFAEIEDMVDLFIATLAELSETKITIILGRTSISRKVGIAEKLAELRTDAALKVHKAAFNASYRTLLEARNAVAHGVLLGKDETGRLCFETSDVTTPEGESSRTLVFSYTPDDIVKNGEAAELLVSRIEQLLKVGDFRAERLQKPLGPHPKGRIPNSAKSSSPPQSSRA